MPGQEVIHNDNRHREKGLGGKKGRSKLHTGATLISEWLIIYYYGLVNNLRWTRERHMLPSSASSPKRGIFSHILCQHPLLFT